MKNNELPVITHSKKINKNEKYNKYFRNILQCTLIFSANSSCTSNFISVDISSRMCAVGCHLTCSDSNETNLQYYEFTWNWKHSKHIQRRRTSNIKECIIFEPFEWNHKIIRTLLACSNANLKLSFQFLRIGWTWSLN